MLESATREDLNYIFQWLEEEEKNHQLTTDAVDRAELIRGFWCNRKLIKTNFENNDLYVVRDKNLAIAFHFGMLISPGITEVHPSYRGRGIGTLIAKECINRARINNVCGLEIDMVPHTSEFFWKKFGFQPVGKFESIAKLPLEYDFQLKKNSNCSIRVEFFSTNEWHKKIERKSFKAYSMKAYSDGITVNLSQRVHPFSLDNPDYPDIYATVFMNDEIMFDDKLKHQAAEHFGFHNSCCFSRFLDNINLSNKYIKSNSPYAK